MKEIVVRLDVIMVQNRMTQLYSPFMVFKIDF